MSLVPRPSDAPKGAVTGYTGRGLVKDGRYTCFEYTSGDAQGDRVVALEWEVQPLDSKGKKTKDASIELRWNAGSGDQFYTSNNPDEEYDSRVVASPQDVGEYLVGDRLPTENSKMMMLLSSLVKRGFPEDNITSSAKFAVGLDAMFTEVQQTGIRGGKPYSITLIGQVFNHNKTDTDDDDDRGAGEEKPKRRRRGRPRKDEKVDDTSEKSDKVSNSELALEFATSVIQAAIKAGKNRLRKDDLRKGVMAEAIDHDSNLGSEDVKKVCELALSEEVVEKVGEELDVDVEVTSNSVIFEQPE